jgi:hypothetical protein
MEKTYKISLKSFNNFKISIKIQKKYLSPIMKSASREKKKKYILKKIFLKNPIMIHIHFIPKDLLLDNLIIMNRKTKLQKEI